MIVDRGTLGPLPSQCVRIEQATPGAWVQTPPGILHCVVGDPLPVRVESRSKSLTGHNCPPGLQKSMKWTKLPMPPGKYPDDEDYMEKFKEFYDGAPGTVTSDTSYHETSDGYIIDFYNEQSEGSCEYSGNEQGNPWEYFDWTSPLYPDFTDGVITGYGPGMRPYYVEYELSEFFLQESVKAPPEPPKPNTSNRSISAGAKATGYQEPPPVEPQEYTEYPGERLSSQEWSRSRTRTVATWWLRIDADDIFPAEVWPHNAAGNPVQMQGTVRCRIVTTREYYDEVEPPENVPDEYLSVPFELGPEDEWQSDVMELDESGEVGMIVTREVVVDHVIDLPQVGWGAPNYEAFPYPGLPRD